MSDDEIPIDCWYIPTEHPDFDELCRDLRRNKEQKRDRLLRKMESIRLIRNRESPKRKDPDELDGLKNAKRSRLVDDDPLTIVRLMRISGVANKILQWVDLDWIIVSRYEPINKFFHTVTTNYLRDTQFLSLSPVYGAATMRYIHEHCKSLRRVYFPDVSRDSISLPGIVGLLHGRPELKISVGRHDMTNGVYGRFYSILGPFLTSVRIRLSQKKFFCDHPSLANTFQFKQKYLGMLHSRLEELQLDVNGDINRTLFVGRCFKLNNLRVLTIGCGDHEAKNTLHVHGSISKNIFFDECPKNLTKLFLYAYHSDINANTDFWTYIQQCPNLSVVKICFPVKYELLSMIPKNELKRLHVSTIDSRENFLSYCMSCPKLIHITLDSEQLIPTWNIQRLYSKGQVVKTGYATICV